MSDTNGNTQDLFPLDDAAISLLADLRAQMANIQAQFQGALVLFIRQQGLKGNWQVHENGRELVRQPAQTEVMR